MSGLFWKLNEAGISLISCELTRSSSPDQQTIPETKTVRFALICVCVYLCSDNVCFFALQATSRCVVLLLGGHWVL